MAEKIVAIAGATGAVGREFVDVLEKRDFPVKELRLLATSRGAGTKVQFKGEELIVEEMTPASFKNVDIALFSAGSSVSKEYRDHVVDAGAVLVDNSSAFRMDSDVPLIIPEVNPEDARKHNGIIANPNCSTIIMLMGVYPLHQKYPVKRIVVSTYQAASGAGWAAMEELKNGTRAYIEGEDFQPEKLPYPYGFNLFSHNSKIYDNGYNQEEIKMVNETRKILHDENIQITATCIRVPVLRAHSESINIEFKDRMPSVDEARKIFEAFPGIQLIDDREKNYFPMPLEASEKYDCLVGRIRNDISQPNKGMDIFIAGDQLLKGAALNAVQIAELLV